MVAVTMKKSSSTSSLTSLASAHTLTPTIAARRLPFGRTVSSNALASMDYVNDMSVHIQVEALTHSSAYNTGMCLAEFGSHIKVNDLRFPSKDLLNVEIKDTQEAAKSFLTCLVTPHEPVEDERDEMNHCVFRTSNRQRRRKDDTDSGYCIA